MTTSKPVDIVFATQSDAEGVLQTMREIIERYSVVTFSDLKDLIGLNTSHIDQKWGWTKLPSMNIRQTSEGFAIEFPPMEEV